MTDSEGRVIVVGSVNADTVLRVPRLPAPGETVTALEVRHEAGGKSANQAAAASLLGAEVSLYGTVGTDSSGTRLLRELAARGVDVRGVTRVDADTGAAFVMVDEAGENSIVVSSGANALLSSDAVPDTALTGMPVVVLALESPLPIVVDVARRANRAGCMVLLNASPADGVTDELLARTSVLVVNRGEVEQLTGLSSAAADWSAVRDRMAARGVTRTVVTLGAAGAIVLGPESIRALGAISVAAVDTTGCGDAFMGALAAELALGHDLVSAAELGIRAGAWAALSIGAQRSYGRRAQLDSLVRA